MPIHGLEWLFIGVILIMLILWDPQKIPKIARAIAEARKEYEKAVSTVQEVVEDVKREVQDYELDERLIETAKSLGIETYGKTREEIERAIIRKTIEEREKAEKSQEKAEEAEKAETAAPAAEKPFPENLSEQSSEKHSEQG